MNKLEIINFHFLWKEEKPLVKYCLLFKTAKRWIRDASVKMRKFALRLKHIWFYLDGEQV